MSAGLFSASFSFGFGGGFLLLLPKGQYAISQFDIMVTQASNIGSFIPGPTAGELSIATTGGSSQTVLHVSGVAIDNNSSIGNFDLGSRYFPDPMNIVVGNSETLVLSYNAIVTPPFAGFFTTFTGLVNLAAVAIP